MYLRHSKIMKNGKTHTHWRLVKSVRVDGKVRQVTVAQPNEETQVLLDRLGLRLPKRLRIPSLDDRM